MKLYVCWGTFKLPLGREHPCREALISLEKSGFEAEVINAHSYGALPRPLQTPTRKRIEDATGSPWVPALETDDGKWISGSEEIAKWAEENAAGASGVQV
ncbi:MAG: glutathione S-transferase N-terminal domain-containing protein [Solirubrobacterales bacterium]